MQIIALDFETFFRADYTLQKLTTEAYVRDPRFRAHGAAIKLNADLPARWHDEPELRTILQGAIDWNETAIICHHAQFDGLILSHHYGVRPKLWLDTLGMARLLLGNHISVSLDSVRRVFGMASKRTPYEAFKGKHWRELDPGTQRLVAEGCCDEVESIWTLFGKLAREFPPSEYELVDMTIRMFTEPTLRGDVDLLARIWTEENGRKRDVLADLGLDAADLQSSERFAALLRHAGVEPALKRGKNGPIYAFAKTDDFMQELIDHDDPGISGLARARLGIKSSAIQTRAETLGWMSQRGDLCIYLRYCAAGPTRWGGGDGSNFQNFKRGHLLRSTILAPEGFSLAVIDASQIECRVLNFLAGQWDIVEKFRNKEDVYSDRATDLYGERIYKPNPDDPRYEELTAKRGAGKQDELMCGYGAGGNRCARVAALGLYGPSLIISEAEGDRRVASYRASHQAICGPNGYWREADAALIDLANGTTRQWGPLTIRDRKIWLPTGLRINYDTLEWHDDPEAGERGWRLKTRQGWVRMWGSKLVQNVCEMVARAIVSEAMVRIARQGLRIVGMSHDEIWVLIPKGQNDHPDYEDWRPQQDFDFCLDAMRQAPAWLPGIPLDAEGTMGERYAK